MGTMTDDERDAFLLEPRLGTLGIGRVDKGPLLAVLWYRYVPAHGGFEMCMGSTSAKAKRLRAEGRATLSVLDAGTGGVYRYVTAEGPVTLTELGDRTEAELLAMSSRYLGPKGGARYTANFMSYLPTDALHDGHGTTEVMVRLHVERWRTDVLG
jgi:nitroimidazol reductase NimA-like FMN-containing flavoprotein (pyridoxamine 5'-phosphate oxidase superfamily)